MATAPNARTLDEAARRGSTPDGGIPTAAALLAAARGRSDDDDKNTTTSSASSPRCSRDATTTPGVAPANVDGGEHDGGDDDLALDAHHIPLMTARNGAESRHLGLLAALEPLDDNAGSAISPEARDMKSNAPRLASIEDFHRDDDLLGAVASALDASKHAHELAPDPPTHTASGSHFLAAKFTSARGLVLPRADAAPPAPHSPQDAHVPTVLAADAARGINVTDAVTSPWKFPEEEVEAMLQAFGLEFMMPTYATWPAFFTALIAKKVHLGETKAVKHRGHAASSSGGVVPHYHAHAQQLIDESSSSDIDSVDLKPEGRIGSVDAEMSAMILQNTTAAASQFESFLRSCSLEIAKDGDRPKLVMTTDELLAHTYAILLDGSETEEDEKECHEKHRRRDQPRAQ